MNQPERFELFVLPDGKKKVTVVRDTRLPNAATIEVQREDYTLGNMLRMALLRDKRVLFAGCKVPHPLEHYFELKVQTTADTTPWHALIEAVELLVSELAGISAQFAAEVTQAKDMTSSLRKTQQSSNIDNELAM